MAPAVGFEPTTNRLTADRSTTELLWNISAARQSLAPPKKLVAGAGFEPAIPQARDYEPGHEAPIIR